ncbi:3-hydroxyacyl-ACP dehydratase FabZ family protein [Kitasatospora sp. NPDC101155]|uniref:3-hydroxyacyl-ACP dehydratase FabZ family protein n=1 Tax=Kitasatospora sp. NPDC101155 TaxID=3364097 RepID=UPI003824392A
MTATLPQAGPVRAGIRIEERTEDGLPAAARVEILATEPVFAGHYPDFPIFPGVCVVDCVHRAATDGDRAPAPTALAAVESARFAGAVYPGDTLVLSLTWRRTDTGLTCKATAATERGKAASVKLRYRAEDGAR